MTNPRKIIHHPGERFGKLVVTGPALSAGNGACWMCRCDCGRELAIRGGDLRAGCRISCGCVYDEIQKQKQATKIKAFRIHKERWARLNARKKQCNESQ